MRQNYSEICPQRDVDMTALRTQMARPEVMDDVSFLL